MKFKNSLIRKARRGFSMIELLAVVGIISVMAVIIGVALGGGNETVSLGNGQRVASSIFQSARSIAVLRQTHTRVIIYRDHGNDPQKFLRYMGVVYLKDGVDISTADSDDWIPANQGTSLPEGVFFIPNDVSSLSGSIEFNSDSGGSLQISKPNYNGGGGDAPTMNAKFPNVGSADREYYFYEFDSNGMSNNPGGSFVLNAGGKATDGSGIETVEITNPYAVAGFAIRKIGGVTLFNDYDEISQL